MLATNLTVSVCIGLSQGAPVEKDEPVEVVVELDAEDDVATTFDYEAPTDGEIVAFLTSESADPRLFVESAVGQVVAEDDNGGGGTTAYVRFPADVGELFHFDAQAVSGTGSARLHIVLVPRLEESEGLQQARDLLAEARSASDRDARDHVRQALELLDELDPECATPASGSLSWDLGFQAIKRGDPGLAERAWQRCRAHRERFLPPTHEDMRHTWNNLAVALKGLGRHDEAFVLEERKLAVDEAIFADDDLALQRARANFAATLVGKGELARAHALLVQAESVMSAKLSPGAGDLLKIRQSLAITSKMLGDVSAARRLQEEILAKRLLSREPEDRELCQARLNLGLTLLEIGEYERALELIEEANQVLEELLPEDNQELLKARLALARTLSALNRSHDALALAEDVARRGAGTLLASLAKDDIASMLVQMGRFEEAEILARTALADTTATHPPVHPRTLEARNQLAIVLARKGDLHEALALFEGLLAAYQATLPPGHTLIRGAQGNVATMASMLGDHDKARALSEIIFESFQSFLPAGHRDLLLAMETYAAELLYTGEVEEGIALLEQVLSQCEESLPAGAPRAVRARLNLGIAYRLSGRFAEGLALLEDVSSGSSFEAPSHGNIARCELALCVAGSGELERASNDLGALTEELRRQGDLPYLRYVTVIHSQALALQERWDEWSVVASSALNQLLEESQQWAWRSSPREADGLNAGAFDDFDVLIGAASNHPVPSPLAARMLVTMEALRGVALSQSRVGAWRAVTEGTLRKEIERVSREVVDFEGHESGLVDAVVRREALQRKAREALVASSPPALTAEEALRRLKAALPSDTCAVSFRRYRETRLGAVETDRAGYAAFIVDRERDVRFLDLGDTRPIERAVLHLRELARSPHGSEEWSRVADDVRRMVLEPVFAITGEVDRLIIVPDGALHLVPFDLWTEPRGQEVRSMRIDRALSLWDLVEPPSDLKRRGPPTLLAVGGVDFGTPDEPAEQIAQRGATFTELPFSRREVSQVAEVFSSTFTDADKPLLLTGAEASKASLIGSVAGVSVVHAATHGYFDPDARQSNRFEGLTDNPVFRRDADRPSIVATLSPLKLCGIVLAAGDEKDGSSGAQARSLTGEEIAGLNMSTCELVVLSACDTAIGVQRPGHGIASLQRAFRMAGARTVIATIWDVDDLATQLLMSEFYRRLWSEGEGPAAALRASQGWLRGRTREEVRALCAGISDERLRSEIAKLVDDDHPFAHPRFWAGWSVVGAGLKP